MIKNDNLDISNFYKDQCFFGSYPNQEKVIKLENIGIQCFVDLTTKNEKYIVKYNTNYNYINFPIVDNYFPIILNDYYKLIYRILDKINKKIKIYIHCRGGHGRSGIVVATLISILYNVNAEKAIEMTTRIHNKRSDVKDKYKLSGSPQTSKQKLFVKKLFEDYHIFKNNILHNNYTQVFKIPNFDYFISVNHAYKYFKDIIRCNEIKNIFKINKYNVEYTKKIILYNILYYKIKNNYYIANKLLSTGFKKIIYKNIDNSYNKNMSCILTN